jgi:tetratricopeptide (TPR) repeat protein
VAAIAAANPAERFREFKAPPSSSAGATVSSAGLSSNGRWQFWSAAVDAFESAPAGGIGSGGYEDWWAKHATVPLFVRNPHSLPLQQAAELGIGGIVLFGGFIAAVVLGATRRFAAGLGGDAGILAAVVAAGAAGAAIDWIWEIPAAFGPAVIAAGLLTASSPSKAKARDSYWLGAGTVAVAWLAMVAGGLVVVSELQLKQSRDDAAHERIADGLQKAKEAHTVLPWAAEPYTQLALLDEARGNINGALANLRSAEARDSEDWRLPLIEARLQTRRGDGPAARAAMERARSLSPLLPIFNTQRASQG